MPLAPVTISLPIADRPASFTFFRDGLGFEPIGEPVDDGVPEPLQFALNDGLRVMLIPTGGFGWVAGSHEVAEPGVSECIVVLPAESEGEVDGVMARAKAAGASVVTEAGQQPWGYTGTFADLDGHLWTVLSAAG